MVSQGNEPGLSRQAHDALEFLVKHEKELDRLREAGVNNMLLDFGVEVGGKMQQSEYLPPELVVALARFRMAIVFSMVQVPRG